MSNDEKGGVLNQITSAVRNAQKGTAAASSAIKNAKDTLNTIQNNKTVQLAAFTPYGAMANAALKTAATGLDAASNVAHQTTLALNNVVDPQQEQAQKTS